MNVIDLLIDKIISVLNVRGTDYVKTYEMAEELSEESALPVPNSIVHEAVQNDIASEVESLQTKALSAPVSINGASVDTVEEAISALAVSGTATPAAGSTKFFTAGGAYADKATVPQSGNNKNFTAGGAFSDKSDVPAEGDTRNFTAGGAFADIATSVVENSTKNLQTRAYATDMTSSIKSVDAVEGQRIIRAGGVRSYFNDITDTTKWLSRVLGRQMCRIWHKGNLDNTASANVVTFADGMFVASLLNAGLWYSTDGKNWSHVQGVSGNFTWIKKVNGKWFAGAPTSANSYMSDNGISWTVVPYGANSAGIEYMDNAGVYVTVRHVTSSLGKLVWAFWSEDLVSWTRCTFEGADTTGSYEGLSFNGIAYKSSSGIAVGAAEYVSCCAVWTEDGKDWHRSSSSVPATGNFVKCVNGIFLMATTNSTSAIYTPNGKTWNTCNGLNSFIDVAYGNGVFVAVKYAFGAPAWSRNGSEWESWAGGEADNNVNIQWHTRAVGYANGLFLIGALHYYVHSTDSPCLHYSTTGYSRGYQSSLDEHSYYGSNHNSWHTVNVSEEDIYTSDIPGAIAFGNGVWVVAAAKYSPRNTVGPYLWYSSVKDIIANVD